MYIDDQLLADIVHKIKNGLGGIGGFATLLDRDLDPEDPRKRLAGRIQDGVNKVNDFVVDLMTLVRMPMHAPREVKIRSIIKSVFFDDDNEALRTSDSVLDGKQLTEKQFSVKADPSIIQKLFIYTKQFIREIGSHIEDIQLHAEHDNVIQTDFLLVHKKGRKGMPRDIHEFMQNGHTIEVRLSLAIMIKMAHLQGGDVSWRTVPHNRHLMMIQLEKEV